jgi:hypothetical protein
VALGRRLGVALLAAAAAAGCARPGVGPEDDGVRVTMEITPQPPAAGKVSATIRILDAEGHPLPATTVELEANMTHPGMKPSFATARLEPPDRWLAELELSMGGDWVVAVEARLEDGRIVRRALPLPGVESR